MRRLWPLFLLILLILPGLPPLLRLGVERALPALGFTGHVGRVSGYALFGLTLFDLDLQGQGIRVKARKLRIGYQLLGLLAGKLPVSVRLEDARVRLDWKRLLEGGAGGGGGPTPVLTGLRLKGVRLVLDEDRDMALPPLVVDLEGRGPYRVSASIAGQKAIGELRLGPRPVLRFRAPVAALRYWYPEAQAGVITGRLALGDKGIFGRARLEGGVFSVVGFQVEAVNGSIALDADRLAADLEGRGLGGPVRGHLDLDLAAPTYRFRVEAAPTWRAVARHFGADLPLSGRGRLVLEGRGWDRLTLSGRFAGEPRLLGYPLKTQGTLHYDGVFRLEARSQGRFYDRQVVLGFGLTGTRWRLDYRDDRDGRFTLAGQGDQARGEGRLAWPSPLVGEARLTATIRGARWRVAVASEGVRLPLSRSFALSGQLAGVGPRVEGRLGPLRLSGRWSDLDLRLDSLPMAVGVVEGTGRYQGTLTARLLYRSPYARLPVEVAGDAGGFRFRTPYGQGLYRAGRFSVHLAGVPVRAGETLFLGADASFEGGRWQGTWALDGPNLRVKGTLEDRSTRFAGAFFGPYGPLAFGGRAGAEGIFLTGSGFSLRASGGAFAFEGALRYGPLVLQGRLAGGGAGYRGSARFSSPWLQGRLRGRGGAILADIDGYARLTGEIWPRIRLAGETRPLRLGPLELPALPLAVTRKRLAVAGGAVDLAAGRVDLRLPFRYAGRSAELALAGDLTSGRLSITGRDFRILGQGPWNALALQGQSPTTGFRLSGRLDLLRLGYRVRLTHPALGGAFTVRGQGARAVYAGAFRSEGVLRLRGEGAAVVLEAEGFSLAPLGLPVRLKGRLGYRRGFFGDFTLVSPYGEFSARGAGSLSLRASGPYFQGTGRLSSRGVWLDLRSTHPWVTGGMRLGLDAKGLWAGGEGVYRIPYLGSRPWRFRLSGTRWRLEGPLAVAGEGLRYRGTVDWPTPFGNLEGRLEGEGTALKARLIAALPRGQATFTLATRPLAITARLPGGTLVYRGGVLRVPGLDLGVLAGSFGWPIAGSVRGRFGGDGLLSGEVAAYGLAVRFALRAGGGIVWLPALDGGLRVRFGSTLRLTGLGRFDGGLVLGRGRLAGRLRYRGPVGATLALSGTLRSPVVRLEAEGAGLALSGELAGRGYRLNLRYQSPLAEGVLAVTGEGLRYRGEGRLRTRRGLLQAGPLRLQGEGGRFALTWAAPLAVVFSNAGWRVSGTGVLEAGHQLVGRLAYQDGRFSGRLDLSGPWLRGRVEGEGSLRVNLRSPWGQAAVGVGADGGLEGTLALALGPLSARARLGGRLPDPILTGEGELLGRGLRVPISFGYRRGPWLVARGPGLWLRLSGRFLEARLAKFDLAPFTGLPLAVDLEGAEALDRFRAPVAVAGPGVQLSGFLDLGAQRLRLAGAVPGGRVDLEATPAFARLTVEHPRLDGTLAWRAGAGFTGELSLRLPLPGGALTGRFQAREGRLLLTGRGALAGTLEYWPFKAVASGGIAYRMGGVGGLVLVGQGRRLRIRGEGGLDPLAGEVDLKTRTLAWHYRGPLPAGTGRLEAGGRFPGRWLEGRAEIAGRTLRLVGEGTALTAVTGGLFAHLNPSGGRVILSGFTLGPLRLSGAFGGTWREGEGALSWQAGSASGRFGLAWNDRLRLRAEGDLTGDLVVDTKGLDGRLAFPGGELRFGPGFVAHGRVLGRRLVLDLVRKRLAFGGVVVHFPWAFEGHESFGGLVVAGEGPNLRLDFAGFDAQLWPGSRMAELRYRAGRGSIRYRDGRLSGRIEAATGPLVWTLEGVEKALVFSAHHPGLAALPYPAGELSARLGIDGTWRLAYAAGPYRVGGKGRGLAGGLELRTPYGGGSLRVGVRGLSGRVALADLPFFGWGLDLDLKEQDLAFTLASPAGRIQGRGRLAGWRVEAVEAAAFGLDLARFPLLKERLPHLEGRLGFAARYRRGEVFLQAGSADLGVEGRRFPLALTLRYRGRFSGELRYAGMVFRFEQGSAWRVDGELRAFPLDLPVAMVVGPLPGEVRLTGRFAGRFDPAQPLDAWFELSGERLAARSGNERLLGRVALAYKDRTLELRTLDLAGAGRWRGGGRWRLGQGGDLWLRAERTDFTPLLRLWPPLARWQPEARGSLFLEANGRTLVAEGSAAFTVAGVSGRFWGLHLAYRADGRLNLGLDGQVERPVRSRFTLAGRGRLSDFALEAKGDLEAPLVGRIAGLSVTLRYPDLAVAGQGPGLALTGRLRPLDLKLSGTLPLRDPRYYLEGGEARVRLDLAQRPDAYHLAGEVAVLRALLAVPEKRPVIERRKGRPLPLVFDRIRIHAEGGVVVNEPLAQGELGGEVYLGGTAASPYLTGEVRALRGSFLLLNHRFQVLSGWARFYPEQGVYPALFLKARASAGTTPVYLLARGRFERRGDRAELVLDTCLSTADAADLEACRLSPQEDAAAALLGLGQGDIAEQAVGVAVKNLLIGQIESELARSLGLDLFQIETEAFEGQGLASTRFTLGKYVSPEFFIAYRLDFAQGSRVYATYQRDGLKLTFATDLSAEPSPEFSVRYAIAEDLALFGRVARDAFRLGLEWRP